MKISRFKTVLFSLALSLLGANSSIASLDVEKLRTAKANGSPEYSGGATAMVQAVGLGLLQSPGRVKIPGWGKFYLETGLQVLNIEDQSLYPFTSNLFAPSVFGNVFGRVGFGLPFGFTLDAGISQIVNEHQMNALNLALSYQLLDFSTWVYTDLVPAVTANYSTMRTLDAPATWGFTGQLNMGAYHRKWWIQLAYAFRLNYSMMLATDDTLAETFIQHGLITHVPLTNDLFLRTEIFLPDQEMVAIAGWQF